MNKVLTFVLTNHTDKEFVNDFYELDNFIASTSAILLLRVNYFVNILSTNMPDYQFRLVIHEGLKNRGGYSRSEAILTELETTFPGLKNNQLVFLTRLQDLFPNQEQVVVDKAGKHINFNKCNVLDIVKHLPVYSKAVFTNGDKSATTLSEVQETDKKEIDSENVDFVIQTALYEDEFAVYETDCYLEAYPSIYNSYKATFKEHKKALADGDYKSEFLLVHQQQMGLVDAAIHATQVITKIDPTFLLMSGVCGGKEHEVNLYDVIIPSIVYDYSTGKIKGNRLESLEYEASANKKLIKYLKDNSDRIIHNMRSIINPDRKKLLNDKFKIVIDEFACGPWVIKTEGFLHKIKGEELEKFPTKEENDLFLESIPVNEISKGIKGMEMESYSLLRAGEVVQKPDRFTIVAKAVMDFTNEYKKDGPNGEIKSSASYVSYLCVRAMMPILLEFKSKLATWTE
ncbi:MAG: hypothetical protein ABJB11_17290 [Ferruginibacter sp.]